MNAFERDMWICVRRAVRSFRAALIAAATFCAVVSTGVAGQVLADLSGAQEGWISYRSSMDQVALRGELLFPNTASNERLPAIVIAHASGGLDARTERWASFLRSHGFATHRIDFFGPRGITWESPAQPEPVDDAADALRMLASHPRIDPRRIGIIGFSRGANMAMRAANLDPDELGGLRYAGHVALYPGCRWHLRPGGSGAPILMMIGSRDGTPLYLCESIRDTGIAAGRNVTLRVYEGAHHGWDGDLNGVFFHRAVNASYSMYQNSTVTELSRQEALAFFRNALGAERK